MTYVKILFEILFDQLMPIIKTVKQPSQFNQAIMELGALICTPKSPQCICCPISANCYAQKHNKQSELPYKSPAKRCLIIILLWD